MSERLSPVIDPSTNKPFVHRNGKARPQLIEAMLANGRQRTARAGYDAARDTDEFQRHWANSDAFDADSSNSKEVRHKLIRRSRYEEGSNGYYDGILGTHANMVVGVGPTLRMLTQNRNFNQFVEREFYTWAQRIQMRRKLWAMCHAHNQDGDGFGLLLNNPALPGVQLDLKLIEAEQCQTPFLPFMQFGYIDGIKFDQYDNIEWYDVLPYHPGSNNRVLMNVEPVRVEPRDVLHWFKMKRPGGHRGVPSMTSTLNLGASSRRWREAVLAAAESAADFNILMKTKLPNNGEDQDPLIPMSTLPIEKRMMTVLPGDADAVQMKAEFPTTTHGEYSRTHVSEQGRPISMPYNAAACDSSTYSFASGKLDTLCYRAAIDVERQDCNDLVLDPLFAQWFREWNIRAERFDGPPTHQWDWPKHPIIDDVADAQAKRTRLEDGTLSYRQAFSDEGKDLQDELIIQAEDIFGEATDETIEKARQIMVLRTVPQSALPYVAQIMGIKAPKTAQPAESMQ